MHEALWAFIGVTLLAGAAWFAWWSWRDVVRAARHVRSILRRRTLREKILDQFRAGNECVDLEQLAFALVGIKEDATKQSHRIDGRRVIPGEVGLMLHELTVVADHMPELETFGESFDFSGDGGAPTKSESCVVPGLYMLSSLGRSEVGEIRRQKIPPYDQQEAEEWARHEHEGGGS